MKAQTLLPIIAASSILIGCGALGGDGGGQSGWQHVDSPAQFLGIKSVEFTDAQRGFLAADGDVANDQRGVWYTADGGESWELKRGDYNAYVAKFDAAGQTAWMGGSDSRELWSAPDGANFQPNAEAIQQQDWIGELHFWDGQTGIALSQTADRIHRTTDGGQTFTMRNVGRSLAPGFNALEALGEEVWLGTGPAFNDDGTGAHLLHSTNLGADWRTIKLEDKAHDFKGGSIQGVHAVNSDVVWAAGLNRQLYWTEDGGQTWSQVKGLPGHIRNFNDIDGQGDHIVAGGSHQQNAFILESTDGGKNWELTYVADDCSEGCQINGIEYVSSELIWAYGDDNTLIRYTP